MDNFKIENQREDSSKLELYRLIGEGYKAMQEGRETTLETIKERISRRKVLNSEESNNRHG
ncbi:MAG: hypothetical protein PHX08_08725 [Lachnospiraceae bacterium]|nr:hypothetical protein [Lachnospiraceae bacterium]